MIDGCANVLRQGSKFSCEFYHSRKVTGLYFGSYHMHPYHQHIDHRLTWEYGSITAPHDGLKLVIDTIIGRSANE